MTTPYTTQAGKPRLPADGPLPIEQVDLHLWQCEICGAVSSDWLKHSHQSAVREVWPLGGLSLNTPSPEERQENIERSRHRWD